MHYTDPQRDGQAELAWLATKVVYPRTTTHSSTNPPWSKLQACYLRSLSSRRHTRFSAQILVQPTTTV